MPERLWTEGLSDCWDPAPTTPTVSGLSHITAWSDCAERDCRRPGAVRVFP